MRFLLEIYLAMREVTSEKFTIGLKINSSDFKEGGLTEEESMLVIQKMDEVGIDFVEISGGSYENPKINETTSKNKNTIFFSEYSKLLKEKVKAPLILTGGIRSEDFMIDLLKENIADLIGIARLLVIEPNIPNLIEDNEYDIIETKRLTTGIKSLDKKLGGLMGIVYYQRLMKAYAKNKKPKITTNAWPSLLDAIFHHGLAISSSQRAKKEK